MRGLLFYWYRGGSTLIQGLLLSSRVKPAPIVGWEKSKVCRYLSAVPKQSAILETAFQIEKAPNPPFRHCVWHQHLSGYSKRSIEVIKLAGPKSKLVYMCRDPRNQIESRCQFTRGAPSPIVRRSERYFTEACHEVAERVKQMVEFKKLLGDRFKLIRMEDLIITPMDILLEIYNYWGINPDLSAIKANIHLQMKSNSDQNICLKHSSFGTPDGYNKRWHDWSKKKKTIFKRVAGNTLHELGYE